MTRLRSALLVVALLGGASVVGGALPAANALPVSPGTFAGAGGLHGNFYFSAGAYGKGAGHQVFIFVNGCSATAKLSAGQFTINPKLKKADLVASTPCGFNAAVGAAVI